MVVAFRQSAPYRQGLPPPATRLLLLLFMAGYDKKDDPSSDCPRNEDGRQGYLSSISTTCMCDAGRSIHDLSDHSMDARMVVRATKAVEKLIYSIPCAPHISHRSFGSSTMTAATFLTLSTTNDSAQPPRLLDLKSLASRTLQ